MDFDTLRGLLTAWWNADDGSSWRWSVEFYNHREQAGQVNNPGTEVAPGFLT